MIIKQLKNKVQIIFDYSTKSGLGFSNIGTSEYANRGKVLINVFLVNGSRITDEEIKDISIRLKKEEDDEGLSES